MANSRLYSAQFSAVAVTAAQDLFELVAPATGSVELYEIHLSQATEVKDAEEEMATILVKSGQTTSGSGGTAPTPVPYKLGDTAFGGTTEVNNTTKASAGTIVTHFVWNWNVRVPFDIYFPAEAAKVLDPSARLTVELLAAPADSITMSGYIVFGQL